MLNTEFYLMYLQAYNGNARYLSVPKEHATKAQASIALGSHDAKTAPPDGLIGFVRRIERMLSAEIVD